MVARTASVTVKLLDQLSAPAKIIGNSLRALRGDMNALAGARLGIDKQIATATARVRELRSSLLGIGVTSLVAGFGLKRLMKSGTEFESVMMDIRQKADLSSEATAKMAQRIREMGPTVNKSAGEVAKGVDFLMGAGLDPDRAMAMMPAIGKAASAYRAEVDDLAKAGYAALNNLKVRTEDFARTLDVMAQSGKEGNFELKDMAQYFAELAAAGQALGMSGNKGVSQITAALQVARDAAGDASGAANNVANLMQKIISPETTKKFKKLGVDIRREYLKTVKQGGDPFVMIAEQSRKALKGDLSKIGDLFEDRQVQNALRPLIQQLDRYKAVRDKAAAATGVVDADYKLRMETFQSKIDKLMNALDTVAIKIADALIPYLGALAEKLVPVAQYIGDLVGRYPEYVAAITAATAALLGLAALGGIIRLLGAGLALFSFKGLRGVLNYLAPKGGGPAAAAASGAGGAAAAAGATAGKFGTATKPGAMTPSQLQAAKQGVANMNAPATALGRLVGGLKNGVVGGLTYYFGTKAIDAGFEALPKPDYPAGYDPNAEMNMGIVDRFMRMWNGYPDANSKPGGPKPIQPADASGDAVKIDGKSSGVTAGTELGQGIKDGLAAQQGSIAAAADAILSALKSKLGAGIDVPVRPKVEGLGAALRGIHADAGI